MLLAAAVTCLIHSLPIQSAVAGEYRSLVNHQGPYWPMARKLGKRRSNNGRTNIGATQWPPQWPPHGMKTRRHLELLKDTSHQLQNSSGKECDPTKVLSDGGGADLGILTCSEGQYCVESMESSLGGYCTDILVPMEGRKLQGNESSSYDLYDFTYFRFCSNNTKPGRECNCTNADRAANTLDIQCRDLYCGDYESQCSVNITKCYEREFSHSLISPYEQFSTTCYTFSKPYDQKFCWNLTIFDARIVDDDRFFKTTECSLEFNGVICNSCKPVPYNETIVYYFGYEFDCTNTEGQHSGVQDPADFENGIYEFALIKGYVNTYGCAQNCSICGDGFEVTKPGQVVTVTSSDTRGELEFECSDLSDLGMNGSLTMAECEDVTDMIFYACGCKASEGTTPPPPNEGTTPAPTSEASIVGLTALGVSLAVMSTLAFAY